MPLLKALILEAEQTGKPGPEKHAAVAEGAEQLYRVIQDSGSIREIQEVPWELVAPIVVGATGAAVTAAGGLIRVIVGMFNRLLGKVWSLFGVGSGS